MKKFQWKISSAKLKCPRCGSKVVMQFVGRWRIRSAGEAEGSMGRDSADKGVGGGIEEGKGIEPRGLGSEADMGRIDDTGGGPPSARDDSDG